MLTTRQQRAATRAIPAFGGPIRPTARLVRSRRSVGSDLPEEDDELCDFATPSRGCGRCLVRWAIFVHDLGEPCPGLRHVEEGYPARRIRDRLGYLGTIHRIQPIAGGRFTR